MCAVVPVIHGEVRSVPISLCISACVYTALFSTQGFLRLRMAAASGSHWEAVAFWGEVYGREFC